MCFTLLPDNRELVLASFVHGPERPIQIISLDELRFMSFVGSDRCSNDARIGFLAQDKSN